MQQLEVARSAAQAGGEVISRYFRDGATMRAKSESQSFDLVSDADIESENAIVEVIRRAFPQHGILAEEKHQDQTDAEHLWIIDPLDGTNNFAHRIPHFAVSIAYYHAGQPKCGVILNPVRQDCYEAAVGQGAFYNGQAVTVSKDARLDQVFVGVGFYYDRGTMMSATLDATKELFHQRIHGIRRMGTASLDLALVGMGCFGAYFEYELSPWDFAAGRLFVEQAGGRVSRCDGRPLPLAKSSLLASNGILHAAVLEIVQRNLPA